MLFAKLRTVWLILFSTLVLCSCNTVEVPDVEWCSSIGRFGAICQNSISDNRRRLTVDQWLDFLEALPDDPSTPINEEKGPALCATTNDFRRVKVALEQLCEKAGWQCTLEQKKALEKADRKLSSIQRDAVRRALLEKGQGRTEPSTGRSK